MKKILIDHVYHCSPEQFFEKLFDVDIRTQREKKGCGAVNFDITESRWEGDTYHQVVVMEEVVDAPKAVRAIFGETTKIEEAATWVKGSDTIQLVYRPSLMGDKVSMVGTLKVSPADGGHCRVVTDVAITAKIFVVGSIVEKLISKALPKRQAKDVAYFNAHQAD